MGCHALLQGILPTQGSNLSLVNWQVNSLSLSHLGSPCCVMDYSIVAQDLAHRPDFITVVLMGTYCACSVCLSHQSSFQAHLCPFSFYLWEFFSLPSCFQNYQKSLNDLNKVLLLDPSIVEAKMELEEVTRILNIKDNTASFNKEKERRKIEIQEVRVFDYLWKYSFGDPILIWDFEVIFLWIFRILCFYLGNQGRHFNRL